MFGTIILDAYTENKTEKMAEYIEEICSPLDTVGWASAGIYSFWDYDSKEILYMGLASDFYVRFKQQTVYYPLMTEHVNISKLMNTSKHMGS